MTKILNFALKIKFLNLVTLRFKNTGKLRSVGNLGWVQSLRFLRWGGLIW